MAYYITRTLAMTQAVNTFTASPGEAGDGSGPITVPAGVSAIKELIVQISRSIQNVADAGGNVLLRLTGNGLVDGQQDLAVGGAHDGTTSTEGTQMDAPVVIPVDIKVKPGNQITPSFAYTGVDFGTPEAAVTCVFA